LPAKPNPRILLTCLTPGELGMMEAHNLGNHLRLARACQEVGGTFTLLWHNTSLLRDWQPWHRTYICALQELAAMAAK